MRIRRTMCNPNLKNDETQYNLQDRIKPGSHEVYYSLPNLYRFNYELHEGTWNSLIIDAVINLKYKFLRMPILFKSYLIRHVMNVILNCQFSQKVVREGYEYMRKAYKTHVSRIKRAKFTETWTPQPSTSNTSEDENEPPRSRLSELKPFNFKQGYFENSSDEEKFNEFLTMTNMVTPQKSTPVTRRRRNSDSSSSEESEALDYTISPKSQFFPDKISTPYPPKRFPDNLVNPVSPIDRPLSLHDELNKAIQTPGDIESQRDKQPYKQTLREAMDIINYPIKTRQSTFNTNPVTDEQQYHDITVSKAKPKDWVSWKETLMQTIPHPPPGRYGFQAMEAPQEDIRILPKLPRILQFFRAQKSTGRIN